MPCPPFAGPPRDPENLSTSDVNKRITRYVGVGLYDDLTCEPDRGAYILTYPVDGICYTALNVEVKCGTSARISKPPLGSVRY